MLSRFNSQRVALFRVGFAAEALLLGLGIFYDLLLGFEVWQPTSSSNALGLPFDVIFSLVALPAIHDLLYRAQGFPIFMNVILVPWGLGLCHPRSSFRG